MARGATKVAEIIPVEPDLDHTSEGTPENKLSFSFV